MNITFKSNSFGETYMDLPQFIALDEARNQYNISKSSVDGDAYFQALINILDLIITYAADVFKGKIFSDEHLISQVFLTETDFKNENTYKQYIRFSLYLASDYASTMKNNILSRKYLNRYECLSHLIESDFEWLIAQYEICFKGADEIVVLHGSAPDLTPRQILFATNQLFYLEETPKISDLDFRNIKPYMMFLLRQLLELLGKNLIGYQNIIDKNGRIVPKMTQVAWQFLHKGNNGEKWKIEIPLPLHCIVKLNK